jgi:hypothetical protein
VFIHNPTSISVLIHHLRMRKAWSSDITFKVLFNHFTGQTEFAIHRWPATTQFSYPFSTMVSSTRYQTGPYLRFSEDPNTFLPISPLNGKRSRFVQALLHRPVVSCLLTLKWLISTRNLTSWIVYTSLWCLAQYSRSCSCKTTWPSIRSTCLQGTVKFRTRRVPGWEAWAWAWAWAWRWTWALLWRQFSTGFLTRHHYWADETENAVLMYLTACFSAFGVELSTVTGGRTQGPVRYA